MGEENGQIVLVFILSAAFVVLLAILLVLFMVIYQKRIVNQDIRLQKLQNERQQVLLKATIEGQERERERMAKDLHDGIGSLLSGLSLNLKYQKNQEDPNTKRAMFLEEACRLVDEGIENVRSVSHNLIPSTLENFGLISAMEECIKPINSNSDLTFLIHNVHEPFRLPKDIALGLLRVFQELVQNTIKHSRATEAVTYLEYYPDSVSLKYMDNGIGFDFDNNNSDGIGIRNMQSRVQALDGIIEINKNVKSGFEVKINIPVYQKLK